MCKLKTTLMLRPGYLLVILFLGMPALVQAQLDDPTRPPGYRLVLPGGKKAGKTVRQRTFAQEWKMHENAKRNVLEEQR